MIFVAGEFRTAITAAQPTVPTPKTTMLDLGCGRAVLKTAPAPVDPPHASGPINSNGRSLGTVTRAAARVRAWVAKED